MWYCYPAPLSGVQIVQYTKQVQLSHNVLLLIGNWFNGLSSSSIVLSDCVFSVNKGSEPRFGERNRRS